MENWRSVVRVSAMTQIFLSKIIIRNFNFYLRIGCKSFVYVLSSGGGPGIVLTTHSGRPAHVYLSSVLVHSLLLPLKTFDPWAFECVISTMWWPPSETRTHTQSQDKNENFWPDRKSNPDRWVGRQGFYWPSDCHSRQYPRNFSRSLTSWTGPPKLVRTIKLNSYLIWELAKSG